MALKSKFDMEPARHASGEAVADGEYVKGEDFEVKKKSNFLESRYFSALILILVAVIFFCLGRVSKVGEVREPVRVLGAEGQAASVVLSEDGEARPASPEDTADGGRVVASKNGTKYHFPWCAGAKQIAEKNLVKFNSIGEARAAGYSPASNCKGLK